MTRKAWNEVTPPAEYLIKLRDQGMSLQQIGNLYGVTRQAISAKINAYLRQMSVSKRGATAALPWDINPKHMTHVTAQALIAAERLKAGDALPPREAELADQLDAKLDEWGAVIDYDWDRGFILTLREPTDGASLIRRPSDFATA